MALGIIICCTQFILGRWLILENKSCVRVPLVITLSECEFQSLLSQRSEKALQMVCEQFHSNNFHKAFEGHF